ncbi:MAG: hypothetical protein BI182_08845 [Acetobacterium sp. MES1]|nr:MAG: hypothetical protein BI182_08845 [Acetobacterium sp. MES1]
MTQQTKKPMTCKTLISVAQLAAYIKGATTVAFDLDFSLLSTQNVRNNKPPAMRVVGKRVIPKNHLSM